MISNKTVSVIIPACNEERYIQKAIQSVREQEYPVEVIVVVNGGEDSTLSIAKKSADKTIDHGVKCGSSKARNLGAEVATGALLIFLDADSYLEKNVIQQLLSRDRSNCYGTVLGKPDNKKFRYRLFFFLKNWYHRIGLYKGVLGGMMYCDRELFQKVKGFDSQKYVDELHDFSVRVRQVGGKYKLIPSAYSVTSMRRFEKVGLLKMLGYWIKVRFFPWEYKKQDILGSKYIAMVFHPRKTD